MNTSRAGTLLPALLLAATVACGGGNDSQDDAFCDDFTSISDDAATIEQADGDDIEAIAERLKDIEPPDDISDAYDSLINAYEQLGETSSLTDPAAAASLSEAQANLNKINSYTADHCD